jgi:hypothetical protein
MQSCSQALSAAKESTSFVINLSDLFNWVIPVVVDPKESMFHLIV